MGKVIDRVGQKFGKLTVVARDKDYFTKGGNKLVMFNCKCDCGGSIITKSSSLYKGDAKSCGCLRNLEHGKAHANLVINGYKRRAKLLGHCFTLTDDEFFLITQKICHYCGKEPKIRSNKSYDRRNGQFIYNGVDRKDNSKGYTIDNCLPCCKDCNYSKRTMTYDEFINYLNRIVKFRGGMC